MDVPEIVEAIKNLNEIDFITVVESVFDKAIRDDMNHVIHAELDGRDFMADRLADVQHELIQANEKLDINAFRQNCSDIEIERLTKVTDDIKELLK